MIELAAEREQSIAMSAKDVRTTKPLLVAMERMLWREDRLQDDRSSRTDAHFFWGIAFRTGLPFSTETSKRTPLTPGLERTPGTCLARELTSVSYFTDAAAPAAFWAST